MLGAVSLIDDDAAAHRLARAIIADIELYNSHDTSESALSAAVAEGRSAFQRRVGPALRGVFEQALAQTRLSALAGEFGAMPHPPPQPRPMRPQYEIEHEATGRPGHHDGRRRCRWFFAVHRAGGR